MALKLNMLDTLRLVTVLLKVLKKFTEVEIGMLKTQCQLQKIIDYMNMYRKLFKCDKVNISERYS